MRRAAGQAVVWGGCPCSAAKNPHFFFRGMGAPLALFGAKRDAALRYAAQSQMLSTANTNLNRNDTDYAFEMAGSNIRSVAFSFDCRACKRAHPLTHPADTGEARREKHAQNRFLS